ncbi:MAG: ABC transporter ATP-binding protein, partial [Caulobacteraceae bacterium]
LKGASLSVAAGEIVGLIGPSGSGKSSLLHAAGLLERPTEGTILVHGRDCSALPDRARTRIRLGVIGFVYQFHHLLAELSAIENVALPVMIAGGSARRARERAARLLADRVSHQPAQLSGGEQQRVAVARALANGPSLLIADEPTGNLDPATSQTVFAAIQEVARNLGVAALIATHNLTLAGGMDRILSLKDGRVEEKAKLEARS